MAVASPKNSFKFSFLIHNFFLFEKIWRVTRRLLVLTGYPIRLSVYGTHEGYHYRSIVWFSVPFSMKEPASKGVVGCRNHGSMVLKKFKEWVLKKQTEPPGSHFRFFHKNRPFLQNSHKSIVQTQTWRLLANSTNRPT